MVFKDSYLSIFPERFVQAPYKTSEENIFDKAKESHKMFCNINDQLFFGQMMCDWESAMLQSKVGLVVS